MYTKGNVPIEILVAITMCVALCACKTSVRKDYNYYKNNPSEASAFAGQCSMNGTMGMVADQIAQCNAARNAYAASKQH